MYLSFTLPNIMGVTRLLCGLSLPAIAWSGVENIFISVLIFAFLLDAVDGPIARYQHRTSVQGSRLDSIADFTVYCSLVIGVYLLWPALFFKELEFILAALASILVPAVTGIIRFGTFTSYHTWLVKIATVCIAVSSVIMILGWIAWPFRLAVVISVFAGLEELVISFILDSPRADVKHIFTVIRQYRGKGKK